MTKSRPDSAPVHVVMEQVSASDAEERLARAFNLILRAAAQAGGDAEARLEDDQGGRSHATTSSP